MDQAVPSTTFVNDSKIKRQKLEETTNNSINRLLTTHFEDLSNELIYQIFELLDSYDVYIIFSNLNLRIENLLTNSNLRINVDLSSISKSNFQHYYKEIIIPHQLRINSIRLTNLFIYNHSFSPLRKLTSLCQLEKLIIHNIQMNYLEELLISLRVLPKLYSSDIEPIDVITNPSRIYDRIFRLPVLKYCQISFKIKPNAILLLETTNKYSSIEHLIIRNDISFHHLDTLLSFIPHLRYLSCLNIFRLKDSPTNIRPIILNKLSHILFQMRHTTFDQFKQWITNLSHRIEVLCI
ncbi:unnamed protein product [Adineta steineri]|uniref:F-box domain-containing protein n=1 Tax=Adineta steineri TaxID=433720 RepID=A0A815F2Y6_9BILA|nr:unnamed protein product [Adineta steineri]CAF1318131.1 unnamed protein product [Adineta steineri]